MSGTTTKLYAGDRAPKAFDLAMTAEDGVDFTGVSAWSLEVRRPDGTTATWAVDEVVGITTSAVTLRHLFVADGSDLPVSGPYDIRAILSFTTGGRLQSEPFYQFVEDPFGTRV